MNILLPQNILNVQVCTVCKKYLSCGPTKVYFNATKCGRCSEEADLGTPSTYEKIAKNLMFPCVNHFEGCNRLLRYEETAEHEKTCIGDMYQCPLCPEDTYQPNSLLYLLNHYRVFHKSNILTKPDIVLHFNSTLDDSYIYYDITENLLVVILVQFDGDKLWINASTVGNRIETVRQRVRISANGTELFTTEFKECTAFGLNVDMFHLERSRLIKDPLIFVLMCTFDFDTQEMLKGQFFLRDGNYSIGSKGEEWEIKKRYLNNLCSAMIIFLFCYSLFYDIYFCLPEDNSYYDDPLPKPAFTVKYEPKEEYIPRRNKLPHEQVKLELVVLGYLAQAVALWFFFKFFKTIVKFVGIIILSLIVLNLLSSKTSKA